MNLRWIVSALVSLATCCALPVVAQSDAGFTSIRKHCPACVFSVECGAQRFFPLELTSRQGSR